MPELGKYTLHVLASYGATLALLGALVGVSWWQSLRVRQRLERAEREHDG